LQFASQLAYRRVSVVLIPLDEPLVVSQGCVIWTRCKRSKLIFIISAEDRGKLYLVYRIKQSSSKHRAIQHTSCTCILNTFAECLLDDCSMFAWSCKRGITYVLSLSVFLFVCYFTCSFLCLSVSVSMVGNGSIKWNIFIMIRIQKIKNRLYLAATLVRTFALFLPPNKGFRSQSAFIFFNMSWLKCDFFANCFRVGFY